VVLKAAEISKGEYQVNDKGMGEGGRGKRAELQNESRLYKILRSVDSLEDWQKEKNEILSVNFCQKILIWWQPGDA
jgi:hypothetical protein